MRLKRAELMDEFIGNIERDRRLQLVREREHFSIEVPAFPSALANVVIACDRLINARVAAIALQPGR